MPVLSKCENFPLTASEVNKLWKAAISYRSFFDEDVAVQCVTEKEIQHLNKTYRDHDSITNVLTFTYEADPQEFPQAPTDEHDIVVCLSVAAREAKERSLEYRDYIALLLVHAFLHVTGMDHERSVEERATTHEAEEAILKVVGFTRVSL
jgi:probable rRNA maturation factor